MPMPTRASVLDRAMLALLGAVLLTGALSLMAATGIATTRETDRTAALRAALERLECVEVQLAAAQAELADVRTSLASLLPPLEPPAPLPPIEPTDPPAEPGIDPPTRPRPPPPVVEPPTAPATGVVTVTERLPAGVVLTLRYNPTRAPAGGLEPRRSSLTITGDVAAWADAEAARLGWTKLPAKLAARIEAEASKDRAKLVAGVEVDPYMGNAASEGGSWGITRSFWDWRRSDAGLELMLANFAGTVGRAHIVADWPSISWPTESGELFAYSLHRQNSGLPGYPFASNATFTGTPDHAHLSRLWGSAAMLYEFTGSTVARAWLEQAWCDMSIALGVGQTTWNTQGAWPAWRSNFAPFAVKVKATRDEGYHGWLGRNYMHQLRFALELVRLGIIDVPGATISPVAAVALFKDAIYTHIEAAPWTDERRFVLQYSPANAPGGGYPVENLPLESKEDRRMALGGESALWVPELRAAGMHEAADGLAAWLGPYPAWAVSLDDVLTRHPRMRWGGGASYGVSAEWYDPWVFDASRVPHVKRYLFPELATAAELLASAIDGWGSNRENLPMDSTLRFTRKELLGW